MGQEISSDVISGADKSLAFPTRRGGEVIYPSESIRGKPEFLLTNDVTNDVLSCEEASYLH